MRSGRQAVDEVADDGAGTVFGWWLDGGQESEVRMMPIMAEVQRLQCLNSALKRKVTIGKKREAILQEEHIKLTGQEYRFRGARTNGMDNSDIEGDTGVKAYR